MIATAVSSGLPIAPRDDRGLTDVAILRLTTTMGSRMSRSCLRRETPKLAEIRNLRPRVAIGHGATKIATYADSGLVLASVIATSAEPWLSRVPIRSHGSADVAITQPLVRGRRDLADATKRQNPPRSEILAGRCPATRISGRKTTDSEAGVPAFRRSVLDKPDNPQPRRPKSRKVSLAPSMRAPTADVVGPRARCDHRLGKIATAVR